MRRRILAAAWRPSGSHTWAPLGPSAGSPGRTGRYASLERHELPGRVRVGSLNGDTAGGSPSAFRGQPGKCDGPLRYAMGDAQTGRRKSSRPGCMHLIWVRGCPPDSPGRQSGRSATRAGDVHAQGPASGLWATQYPSRPTSRLDRPRTAVGPKQVGAPLGQLPRAGRGRAACRMPVGSSFCDPYLLGLPVGSSFCDPYLLGPTNPCPIAVHTEPFSTSAFKVLI